jgi:hypothetical protein
LKPVEEWHLYRFIGNATETSIRNNDYCEVSGETFELADFHSLKRLKSNSLELTAYWLPNEAGSIERVYLYQGETYIGEAVNRAHFAYNENAIERTEEDRAGMLHQHKRLSIFDKFIKDVKADLPTIGQLEASASAALSAVSVEIVETVQPVGYEEEYETMDYSVKAIQTL